MFNGGVRRTIELDRILSLPRRDIPGNDVKAWGQSLVPEMTEILSRPGNKKQLRPAQALALHDIGTCGGAFCPLGVGEGKTLITLLAAWVTGAKRPLLLLPATLIKKTDGDKKTYGEDWIVTKEIRLFSYEMLGRVQGAEQLEEWEPDLIIADECHKLKNKRAAVTKRVARYMQKHPNTKFVALSGTVMRKSLKDFAHILRWCLKDKAPIPKTENETDEWAAALDENVSEMERYEPGALLALAPGGTTVEDARRGFRARLLETPGVVATLGEGERVDCSIYIRAIKYEMSSTTDGHFRKLRKEMLTPDDWQLMQAVDVWRHARELSLGFHYVWSPRPPDKWRNARRTWAAFVRETLSRSRTLDSELQVANACDDGKLNGEALKAWRKVRDTFTPNTVAIWHDDAALNVCLKWMQQPGIVWTEHSLFAERLAELSGCKYYGAKGYAADGTFIDDADPTKAAIVSIDANREGRNLQTIWSRNLVTSPPEGSDVWQQMLGRTHRPGQLDDQVEVDVLLGCSEHANAWRKAITNAYAVRDTTGAESKLLIADVDWPTDEEINTYAGARWRN